MKEFKDRVAVVTGAASGIGLALADRFGSVGMKVVLADVDEDGLGQAVDGLKSKGVPALAVATDVSKPDEVERLSDRAFSEFGAVHVLCNNAGVAAGGPVWQHTLADWQWVLGVNLWGVIHGIRSFVPRMIEQNVPGHIVNTASIAGLISSPYISVYGASKHAVVAITESLAMELQANGAPIGASVLCPGFVSTRIAESDRNRPAHLENDADRDGDAPNEVAVREMARQQVSEGIRPAEVADQVLEALRDERFYVLTHPRYEKLIRRRFDNILAGKTPKFDPQG